MNPAEPTRQDRPSVARIVRFLDLEKFLAATQLPALDEWTDDLSGALLRVDAAEVHGLRESYAAQARKAARDLVGELELERPPFQGCDLVLGIGDSITADALSWFEIVTAAAALLGSRTRFVNGGIPGDTTVDVSTRLRSLLALRADHVVVMVGTNDCKRLGPGAVRLVSAGETERQLDALHSRLRDACGDAVTWLTPPLVDEEAIAGDPLLAADELAFHNDDVRQVGAAVRRLPVRVIDAQRSFEQGAAELWDDGLHPSLRGQLVIARQLLLAGDG